MTPFSFFDVCWIEKEKDGKNRPLVVEATGLEPAASWSQTKRDTKLRHASIAKSL